MGAACDTICSRDQSINAIQPDTEIMKSRTGLTMSDTTSIVSESEKEDKTHITPKTEGITPTEEFQKAIKQGNADMVASYLEEYSSLNLLQTTFKNNDTPLHTAVRHKQHNIIQQMLEAGSSVNAQNTMTGDTALHVAASINDIQSVQLLLKSGADAYITNNNKETPLTIAQQFKYQSILNEFGEEAKADTLDVLSDDKDKQLTLATTNRSFAAAFEEDTSTALLNTPDLNTETNEEILTKYNTARLACVTDDILDDIHESMSETKQSLPVLQAWLWKKQHSPPYSWLKRWTVVEHDHLLWSYRQISIEHGVTMEEKKRWNHCVNLRKVASVVEVKSKKQCRFKVSIKGDRDYIWRAKSTQIRDEWVKGLTTHVEYTKMSKVYS